MKEKICGIYCIENMIDNKKYIGYSKDVLFRIGSHKRDLRKKIHFNSGLQYAFDKYKEENFNFWIIQQCSEEFLPDMEIYWIAYYNSYIRDGGGYNMSRGGEKPPNQTGFHHSEEFKKKLSILNTGSGNPNFKDAVSEKNKTKLENSKKSKTVSDETRKKMSDSKTGEKNNFYGRHHTEESKEKISNFAKNKIVSDETRKKISNSEKGKVVSEDTKRKQSESATGKKKSDETRKRMSVAQKKWRYEKKFDISHDNPDKV